MQSEVERLLSAFGVHPASYCGGSREIRSPLNGEIIAHIRETTVKEAKAAIGRAHQAFLAWRKIPAPKRGEFVRLLGEELRANKVALGRLVTIEVCKIVSEGLCEVQ